MENLKKEVNRLVGQLEEKQKKISILEKKLKELTRKAAETESDKKKLECIGSLNSYLKSIFNEYSNDMRNKLTKESTEIFKELIDTKDKDLIDEIKINDKYEIEIYNWNGINITQDISQGQRQVVALSFITALAKIAAGSKGNIDFPLFMDTPFGRMR